jgi:hypothetical protein
MNKILPIVNIGSKSGKFKYILAQLGQKYLIRGDPAVDYHGRIINYPNILFYLIFFFRENI